MPFDWLPWRRRQPAPPGLKPDTSDAPGHPATLHYHAATALTGARVRAMPTQVDGRTPPASDKRYPRAARHVLTEQIDCDLPNTLDLVGRLGHRPAADDTRVVAWNLEAVSRLCYYAYGPTVLQEVPGATLTLRAVPSAGARYPCELYLALRGASGLRTGVYHYAAGEHALETLHGSDCLPALMTATGDLPDVATADAVVLVSSIWWRSAWKYGDRAYRYCLQDAGHVAGNVALVAMALGYRAAIIHHFVDAGVSQLLGLDPAVEAVQVLVAIQATAPEPATAASAVVAPSPLSLVAAPDGRADETAQVAALVRTHMATTEQDRAAVLSRRTCVLTDTLRPSRTEPAWLVPLPHTNREALPAVSLCQSLLERRSAHHFAPATLAGPAFACLMQALTSEYPADVPAASQRAALDVYLIVNDVAGVPPGAYRYLVESHSLLTIRTGNLREWGTHLALDQTFCREAAALAFFVADLGPAVGQCGDRVYRTVHIEAGMRGQATYLAAHALGVGCTAIGAFFDLEVTSFFAAPEQAAVIYVLALGTPADF
jgi:SagB-type dehydrogenase family enzyme